MSGTLRVPVRKPSPDWRRFIKAVTTDYEPPRPPVVEYLVDAPVMKPVLEMMGRRWVQPGPDRDSQAAYWDNYLAFWLHMGYDYVRLELPLDLPRSGRAGGVDGRTFVESGRGPIGSWEDFEKYPWPKAEDVDFFPYEYISAHLPDGLGMICSHCGGVFEHLSFLMGYETLCLALHDDPELVAAVSDRLGELMVDYYRRLLKIDGLIAVWPGDDMGFRSGTLVHPDDLRRFILPWHRTFARMTHEAGIPYFLHSCGNVAEIMEDLIDDVGIDAKHSFEDAIMPASEFKRLYGGRIGTLGGVDVDVLARAPAEGVRRYVRNLIDQCAPGGRFAVGSGNSIPDYISPVNYLTMMDEALA